MNSNYENMNLFDFICLICNKLAALFKWIVNTFLKLTHLCIRYWYVMVICVALGFFGARLWIKPFLTRYKGYATVTFVPGMKRNVEEGFVAFLTQTIETKRDVYGLPAETQLSVKKFLFYNIIDAKCDGDADYIDKKLTVDPIDSLNEVMNDRLALRIDLWGTSDFECFEKGLTKWFSTQDKFYIPDQHHKKVLRERLEYVNHEIERTDSFMNHFYFSNIPQAQQINIYNNKTEENKTSALIYNEMLELMDEKQYIEDQLELNPDVINFQTHFYYETMIPKQKYLICLCAGFVLGILVSLVIKYWSNVKQFILTK